MVAASPHGEISYKPRFRTSDPRFLAHIASIRNVIILQKILHSILHKIF